ncbi:MAG TPA: SRPBCC domain-containing protein [Candidatus Binataceae bacterium]|nr:SRPBCC domain-containing protein [Candidatus Binataceae bacterium]
MGAIGSTSESAPELVVTRVFDAPRRLVFEAWTKPEHMMRWWGPKSYSTPACEMDVRPGGAIRLCMRSSDGVDLWVRGTYREVVPPERLVFTACNEADPDAETVITVTFVEQAGGTLLTMRQSFAKPEVSRGAKEGWNGSFDRLGDYLNAIR